MGELYKIEMGDFQYPNKQLAPFIRKYSIDVERDPVFRDLMLMFEGQPNYQIWAHNYASVGYTGMYWHCSCRIHYEASFYHILCQFCGKYHTPLCSNTNIKFVALIIYLLIIFYAG